MPFRPLRTQQIPKTQRVQKDELLDRQVAISKVVAEIENELGIQTPDKHIDLANVDELGEYLEAMFCEDEPDCLEEIDKAMSSEITGRLARLAAQVQNIRRADRAD